MVKNTGSDCCKFPCNYYILETVGVLWYQKLVSRAWISNYILRMKLLIHALDTCFWCQGFHFFVIHPTTLLANSVMLGLHRTPERLGTDLRPKNDQTRGYWVLVGKVVCSSYVTHQKIISYSWILAITRAYSPLKSTNSTIAFNRQKLSWNLSISPASDPTHSWIRLWSQVFAGWS